MSDTTVLDKTELVTIPANTIALFTDDRQFSEFYERIKRQTDDFKPDLSTDKGRKEIAAMAFKVTKAKTALDTAGKTLTEDARRQIDQVNAARRVMWDQLETLAKEVRQPLTEWETREKARIERCEVVMARLKAGAVVTIEDTAETAAARLAEIKAIALTEAEFGELLPLAEPLKETAVSTLTAAIARLTQEEADRAELDRLRLENAAREQREAEEHAAAEAARAEAERAAETKRQADEAAARAADQRAKDEAEAAERAAQVQAEREAAVEAERVRVAAEADEARLQAVREAEEEAARELAEQEARATEERRQLQAAHDAELAKAQQERDAAIAEQRRQDEERRRTDEAAAAVAEQRRREDEARTQDRAHRSTIMGAAKEALMASCDLTEPVAKQIVLLICAGDIPHVSVRF